MFADIMRIMWENGKKGKEKRQESTKNCCRTIDNRSIAIEAKRESNLTARSLSQCSNEHHAALFTPFMWFKCNIQTDSYNHSRFALRIRRNVLKFVQVFTEVHRTSYLRSTSLNDPLTSNERGKCTTSYEFYLILPLPTPSCIVHMNMERNTATANKVQWIRSISVNFNIDPTLIAIKPYLGEVRKAEDERWNRSIARSCRKRGALHGVSARATALLCLRCDANGSSLSRKVDAFVACLRNI